MSQEQRYLEALSGSRRLERKGASLLIHTAGPQPLRFAPQ